MTLPSNVVSDEAAWWQVILGICSLSSPVDDDENALFSGPQFREAWDATRMSGLHPGMAECGDWARHPESPLASDGRSVYSTHWDYLQAVDWWSFPIGLHLKQQNENDRWVCSKDNEKQTRYHGTNFTAVIMIVLSGGFVPGSNGHGWKGKYFQGCFTADSLGQAFSRADALRVLDGAGNLRACSMPVVLELEAINVKRYHSRRADLGVTPGPPGVVIRGVWITRIHVNWLLVEKFMAYAGGRLNVPTRNWVDFTCCHNIGQCGSVTKFTCEPWREGWQKSRKGHWYCRLCTPSCIEKSPWHLKAM